jgi:glycosyltransferase involved in cell wall biosynthesis
VIGGGHTLNDEREDATSLHSSHYVPGLVSTIIPVFNRAILVQRAVESALAQTYSKQEIIIVDDGSTDDTGERAKELSARAPDVVRVFRQANAGPGAARRFGVTHSRGEYLQFLDSDDRLLPSKLSSQVEALTRDSEAGVAYGRCYAVSATGQRSIDSSHRCEERLRTLFPALLAGRVWPTLIPLYRRSVYDRSGGWPLASQLEDYVFDARVAALGTKLAYVDEYLAEVHFHGGDHFGLQWRRNETAHRERISALLQVLELALKSSVVDASPELQQYTRTLLLESRIAAKFGLVDEAKRLSVTAKKYSFGIGWRQWLFEAYASVFGWQNAGNMVSKIEKGMGIVRGA